MRLFFRLCFYLFSTCGFAQSGFFETSFGSGFPDMARSAKQMSDSFIYVTGFTIDTIAHHTDAKLYKLNKFGALLWSRTYATALDDNAVFIELSSDNNLLLCGEIQTSNNGLDGFVTKLDTAGNIIWQQFYGGIQNESINRIAELENGNLVLVGFESAPSNSLNMLVRVTDSFGNELYNSSVGRAGIDVGINLLALADTGFLIVGNTREYNSNDNNVEVLRFDKNANVIWDSIYGDVFQNGVQGVLQCSDGNFIFYGETEVFQSSPFEIFMHKINQNGNSLWWQTFGGQGADAGFSIVETTNGFIGTGYSSSLQQGPISLVVFKTDSAGNLIWSHTYGGPGIDIGYEIIPALGAGFFIVGNTNVAGDDQCYLLYVDNGGWTSIQHEFVFPTMVIYPNPNSGCFYLQIPENELYGELKVFSAEGKLIYSILHPAGKIYIDTILPRGYYTISFEGKFTFFSTKLIIN